MLWHESVSGLVPQSISIFGASLPQPPVPITAPFTQDSAVLDELNINAPTCQPPVTKLDISK